MRFSQAGNVSRRTFVTASAASVAALAAAGALAGCSSSDEPEEDDSTSATSDEWEAILEEANGQTVTFLAWGAGGADAYMQQLWDELTARMADQYGIDLQCVEYDAAEYQKISTDLEEGLDASYDIFWYTGSMFTPIIAAGEGILQDQWMTQLPNNEYLNMSNDLVIFDGVRDTDQAEVPFQGCQQALVYSQDKWDRNLAWDESDGDIHGLFHNFTELAQWVQLYPGMFSYMDLDGAGSFHGSLLCKSILAELTNDDNGGWTTVYDEGDDDATIREKVQANIAEWYDWANSDEASEEAFYEKANYLWAYLNDLAPYLMQGDDGPFYVATAPDMMSYVMAGDLACTFTTCTSVASRVEASPESYMDNPAIYLLQTAISYWDYAIIPANSTSQAGAKVVCNYLLDPQWQADAFEISGNGYNIDYDKLDSDQQAVFDDMIAEMGALSPTTDEVAQNAYADYFGPVASWIVSGWDQYVR